MRKRIKEPPPEFFRFQQWYNCAGAEVERCFICDKEIRKGVHDLVLDRIYCFSHADEDGVKDRYYYDLRCYVCGRFVKPDGDLDVPWGSVVSTEPPPERRYCPVCAEKEKAYHIKHGWVPTCYVQATWQVEAAKELEKGLDQKRIYADYEIEAAEDWMDGQRGFTPKNGGDGHD